MSTGWTLRSRQPQDDEELARLLVKVDSAWKDQPFRFEVREGGLKAALAVINQPASFGLVAQKGERIVGYGAICDVEGLTCLFNVMVDPEEEGQGIGSDLVTTLCVLALEQAEEVYLEVLEQSTQARGIYTKIGFEKITQMKAGISGRTVHLMKLARKTSPRSPGQQY